ncbi:unnamed protein product, partial [Staurois parvus]
PSSAAHLCPVVPPTCAQHLYHQSVPSSWASQCPAVGPVSAQQCHQSVPSIAVSQCRLSVLTISTHHQCRLSVPPH